MGFGFFSSVGCSVCVCVCAVTNCVDLIDVGGLPRTFVGLRPFNRMKLNQI